jgi:hypothetical protein
MAFSYPFGTQHNTSEFQCRHSIQLARTAVSIFPLNKEARECSELF